MGTFTPTPTNETSAYEFDDADPPQAVKINPLGEAAFNTAKWAANRIPRYFVTVLEKNDDSSNVLGDNVRSTSYAAHYELYASSMGSVIALDLVQFQVTFQVGAASASAQVFALGYSLDLGAVTALAGSRAEYFQLGGLVCCTLTGSLIMPDNSVLHLWLMTKSPDGIVNGYFKAPLKMTGQVWRPTA